MPTPTCAKPATDADTIVIASSTKRNRVINRIFFPLPTRVGLCLDGNLTPDHKLPLRQITTDSCQACDVGRWGKSCDTQREFRDDHDSCATERSPWAKWVGSTHPGSSTQAGF